VQCAIQFRLPLNVPALLLPDTPVIQGNVLSVLPLAMSGLQGGTFAGPEAEFLDGIQTKVLRVFLLAIHSFALRYIFLKTHATSYVFLQFSYCTL
jgi:hypothetical protein